MNDSVTTSAAASRYRRGRWWLGPWARPVELLAAAAYNVTGMFVGIVTFTVIVTLLALSVGLLPAMLLGIPGAWLTFLVSRGFGRFERGRHNALTDVIITDPVPPLQRDGWFARLRERLSSGPRWRELSHHLLLLPLGTLGFVFTVAAWSGSLLALGSPAYVDHMPGGTAKYWFFDLGSGPGAWLMGLVGLVGVVVVAPWVTVGWAKLSAVLARALLGSGSSAAHAAQVRRLEQRRSAAVDSAESERRRIERDLHDGAQQRLVALAASLGSARDRFDQPGFDPETGRQLVAEAHEEAKAALKEIRDLVRGIHPVILEDRGLDAALSAVVARSPIPVALDVTIPRRPPPAIESAAYFIVNEALTNVARHADATRATVTIVGTGERLVIEVRDDGIGGAAPEHGSGLRGLQDRVTALGGGMYVISPIGGPTSIMIELPCGS